MSWKSANIRPGRTKRDPVTIRNSLSDGSIELKITASREDWERLFTRYFSDKGTDQPRQAFAQDFYKGFLVPWFWKVKKPRVAARSGWEHTHLGNLKAQAAYLYLFFQYVFNTHRRRLPEFIVRIGDHPDLFTRSGRDPSAHAAFLMQHVWGKETMKRYGIKAFFPLGDTLDNSDLQNFYITYVAEGRKLIKKPWELQYLCLNLVEKEYDLPARSYASKLLLQINKAGMGGGIPECTETFESPDDVKLKAVRDLVYTFLREHYQGDWP